MRDQLGGGGVVSFLGAPSSPRLPPLLLSTPLRAAVPGPASLGSRGGSGGAGWELGSSFSGVCVLGGLVSRARAGSGAARAAPALGQVRPREPGEFRTGGCGGDASKLGISRRLLGSLADGERISPFGVAFGGEESRARTARVLRRRSSGSGGSPPTCSLGLLP